MVAEVKDGHHLILAVINEQKLKFKKISKKWKFQKKLRRIVSLHTGVNIEQLTENTFIEEDLKITGDDTWELIEDIQQKLNIDFSAFDFTRHFIPEVGGIENEEYGYYPVSIGHLIEVAEKRVWFMPPKDIEHYAKTKKHAKQQTLFLLLISFITFIALILSSWR